MHLYVFFVIHKLITLKVDRRFLPHCILYPIITSGSIYLYILFVCSVSDTHTTHATRVESKDAKFIDII